MTNKRKFEVSYDDIADVLYLTSGKIRYTKNAEDEAGLILRMDLATREPVGATIVDYREHWAPKREHLAARLAGFFRISVKDASNLLNAPIEA
jgi:hypothetical protein